MSHTDWVIQVKAAVDHLNKVLKDAPKDVDLTVSSAKVNDQAGVQSYGFADADAKSSWQVTISATKTERLL